jgi:hypothetical protein
VSAQVYYKPNTKAKEIYDEIPLTQFHIGRLQSETKKSLGQIEKSLIKCIKNDSNFAQPYAAIGNIKMLENDFLSKNGAFSYYSKYLEKLYRKRILKKIESNDLYFVRKLRYSDPYLLPKANEFIVNICRKYNDSCLSNDLDYIPLTITSMTRTKESVKRLTRNNQNAIEESAHLMGKTFDISYKAFGKNVEQFKLFTAILNEDRKEQRCFVKYERNGCLHITVN